MFCRIIRHLFLLVVFFLLTGNADLFGQNRDVLSRNISINLPADSLIKTLRRIEQRSGSNFAFNPDLLRSKRSLPVQFSQEPLEFVLSTILFGSGLDFKLVGNDIVIAPVKPKIWTINGRVRDVANGEEKIGATIQIPDVKAGVVTNQYGFYSLSVPEGDYELLVSYPGYQVKEIKVHLDQDRQYEIELSLLSHHLAEVEINNSKVTPNPILINEQNFSVRQLNGAAYYAGEKDVLKRLQMQNGIKAITEGSSGLFVRGGNSDQNLILLDEAVIYNPSHLYGLVSVFNSDAVNNIQVYRDYMPANFGGRLSSVIVNRTTEGSNKEYHVSGGVNLMSARIAAEGPIVKDKGSFTVAYRRSLLDVFQNKFNLFNPRSVYYDVNAKANYKLDKDNSLFYSMYYGKDHLLSDESYSNDWGNLTSTLRWNHIFNTKVFLNVSAIYSNYNNLLDLNADTLSQKSQWSTAVKDATLKADFTYYRSPSNQIKYGVAGTFHRFTPGESYKRQELEYDIERDNSVEAAIYFTQQISLNRSFELNYGIRLGGFFNSQKKRSTYDLDGNLIEENENSSFVNPEPRINFSYLPSDNQRLFITYNLNYQYLQLVQNSVLAFSSLEPWIPASEKVKPQRSNHLAMGYRFTPGAYVLSAGAYVKKLDNQPELLGHAQIIRNPDVRSQIRSGRSDAYGVEAEVSKTEGRFTGTVAYTYSRAYRKIADINYGDRYIANYDIPHELKLTADFVLNERLSFQSFFTYSTGRPLTLPIGYYQHDGLNVPIFEGRNTNRFPDFSRLDFSAKYKLQTPIKGKRLLDHNISIGIYNVYNRKNPLYYQLSSSSFEERRTNVTYGFGFYPWVAYSFKL
ncbi:MAG: TonB-dependent receptor [Pedobacter sp.]|nr:MAG: TonB-dependent receptor [Pedobacter sp.]